MEKASSTIQNPAKVSSNQPDLKPNLTSKQNSKQAPLVPNKENKQVLKSSSSMNHKRKPSRSRKTPKINFIERNKQLIKQTSLKNLNRRTMDDGKKTFSKNSKMRAKRKSVGRRSVKKTCSDRNCVIGESSSRGRKGYQQTSKDIIGEKTKEQPEEPLKNKDTNEIDHPSSSKINSIEKSNTEIKEEILKRVYGLRTSTQKLKEGATLQIANPKTKQVSETAASISLKRKSKTKKRSTEIIYSKVIKVISCGSSEKLKQEAHQIINQLQSCIGKMEDKKLMIDLEFLKGKSLIQRVYLLESNRSFLSLKDLTCFDGDLLWKREGKEITEAVLEELCQSISKKFEQA